ncbi:hypothetical protein CEXT_261671 [Caerostris extrusa]|uniref:Secreted protein n=1 Tax=Caerostris extrusa TaxID=172846 RepID=A0AAV4RQ55_CAEEX|nr:hypothetical protein CEXT_261671 [Caerostris extrusa]
MVWIPVLALEVSGRVFTPLLILRSESKPSIPLSLVLPAERQQVSRKTPTASSFCHPAKLKYLLSSLRGTMLSWPRQDPVKMVPSSRTRINELRRGQQGPGCSS